MILASQAAKLLGVHKRTVHRMAKRRGIGKMHLGRLELTVFDVLKLKPLVRGVGQPRKERG